MTARRPLNASRPSRGLSQSRLPGPHAGLSIGLVGGSFDPAHSGHRHLADTAFRHLGLDWIWVVPAAGNPLKRTQTAFADRLASARHVLGGPRTRFSTIEAERGLTYSIDLIKALQTRAPHARFVWIMGADSLRDMHRWKAWKEIARLVPIAVISRPGATQAGLSRAARLFSSNRLSPLAARTLASRKPPVWVLITAPFDPSSSSAIRAARLHAPQAPA